MLCQLCLETVWEWRSVQSLSISVKPEGTEEVSFLLTGRLPAASILSLDCTVPPCYYFLLRTARSRESSGLFKVLYKRVEIAVGGAEFERSCILGICCSGMILLNSYFLEISRG